ncbi:uncharacterized protein BDZ99DRAFT_5967 [Mytilinidion resinicola]|uniref:Clavaminate synthase-like protein n=1 Tax=Mytilinidion resinicola TaxID=574789 RepID=A0A6A6Z8B4_9PEZI|nr:uncharacterized protein BDZ99DRAFT_5967 [Mytilinidion resinicola]KAF2816973.1 hypothetical protein BDZ99DRAFT_5967 [Mytilinidion resinicola]
MPHAEQFPPTPESLFVNDGPLAADQVGLLRASNPDLPLEELRQRYEEDGYLFLKGLLPRQDVLKAREEYFKLLSPSGVLKDGTAPVDGIFNEQNDPHDYPGIGAGAADGNGKPGGEKAEKFVDLALQAHYETWYKEDFCKHPVLRDLIAKLTGWGESTLGVRRSLLRNNTPGNKAIGVHYDQIFLRHGEPTSVTAWVPMGDVSLSGGGLIYLEKGYTLGREVEDTFTKKARECGMSDEEARNAFNQNMLSTGLLADGPAEYARRFDRRWLVTAYEAGDVVLHTPFAVSSRMDCKEVR